MAITSPNLGLKVWNLLDDPYDHAQLADNWAKVDQHDHSNGKGVQIPTGGIANGAISTAKLANEAVTAEKLAAGLIPNPHITWYTPCIISKEESRSEATYGVMETPDQITNVALPPGGLFLIWYDANFKSSASEAGEAAIFIGANQLKYDSGTTTVPIVQGRPTVSTTFHHVTSGVTGLEAQTSGGTWGGNVQTGQVLGWASPSEAWGGATEVFAEEGTYTISVRFKASSGTVSAKERTLRVAVLG